MLVGESAEEKTKERKETLRKLDDYSYKDFMVHWRFLDFNKVIGTIKLYYNYNFIIPQSILVPHIRVDPPVFVI